MRSLYRITRAEDEKYVTKIILKPIFKFHTGNTRVQGVCLHFTLSNFIIEAK